MVHMFLVVSTAQGEICTSKSCATEQASLIQLRPRRAGRFASSQQTDHSRISLGCSSKEDDDTLAIQAGAQMGHNLTYGCLELKNLCHHVDASLGGNNTLAQIRNTCPETCGVPCNAKCDEVFQCDWGMLTTVAQTTEGCDVVTCTALTPRETTVCPWLVGTTDTESFQCRDGTTCNMKESDCCNDKGGRVKCPSTHPYMCNEPCPFCDPEGVSYSCQTTTCNANGGYRTCLWNKGKRRQGGWKGVWKNIKRRHGENFRIMAAKFRERRARNKARRKAQRKALAGVERAQTKTSRDVGDAELATNDAV